MPPLPTTFMMNSVAFVSPFYCDGGKPFSHSELCICFEIVNISFKYICWNAPVLLRFFLNLLPFATINKPFNGCSSTFSIMKT